MSEDIYKLKLHEALGIIDFIITRVPGGWIYDRQEPKVNISNPVFVPFDNEFQELKNFNNERI